MNEEPETNPVKHWRRVGGLGTWEGRQSGKGTFPPLPQPRRAAGIRAAPLVAANMTITSSWFHQESHGQVHLYNVTIRCRIVRKATLVRSNC